MKKYSLIVVLLIAVESFGQPGKKPAPKEKAPSRSEMQQMINDAEKEFNNLSPEDKKAMEEMGIKVPDLKKMNKEVSGMSDKQLEATWDDENRLVPKKDAARIKSIPSTVTDARMKGYINAVHTKSTAMLDPDAVKAGKKITDWLAQGTITGRKLGNVGLALWMDGRQQIALYLMGVAASQYPNADNLSNYAAMLSMMGGQHLAIPILENLQASFPGNSTLLNNLGQAWFGLGDLPKAEKYLDSTLRFYVYHPQANFTKALIHESKGNKNEAIEHVKKSIRHAYSDEKKEKLKKLGYNITKKDIRTPLKPDTDPLGLFRTKRPDYPLSLSDMQALNIEWEEFDAACTALLKKLRKELEENSRKYASEITAMSASIKHISKQVQPLHMTKASLILKERESFYTNKIKQVIAKNTPVREELSIMNSNRKPCAPESPCSCFMNEENNYIKQYNELKQKIDEELIQLYRQYFNEIAFWSQYTAMTPSQYNVVRYQLMINWLEEIHSSAYKPYLTRKKYSCVESGPGKPKKSTLSDYDVVACKYKSSTDLYIMSFTINCSKMESKLNLKFIEFSRTDDFNRAEGDTYTGSTLKISVEKGVDDLTFKNGPLKVEAKIGAGIEIEMDRSGLKDIILSAEAKTGFGTSLLDDALEEQGSIGGKDMVDTTVEAGVEAKISLISGKGDMHGTGKLEKIILTAW